MDAKISKEMIKKSKKTNEQKTTKLTCRKWWIKDVIVQSTAQINYGGTIAMDNRKYKDG